MIVGLKLSSIYIYWEFPFAIFDYQRVSCNTWMVRGRRIFNWIHDVQLGFPRSNYVPTWFSPFGPRKHRHFGGVQISPRNLAQWREIPSCIQDPPFQPDQDEDKLAHLEKKLMKILKSRSKATRARAWHHGGPLRKPTWGPCKSHQPTWGCRDVLSSI